MRLSFLVLQSYKFYLLNKRFFSNCFLSSTINCEYSCHVGGYKILYKTWYWPVFVLRLVYIWFMFGLCLVYVWFMFGLCLVYVWFMFGLCLVFVWFMSGFINYKISYKSYKSYFCYQNRLILRRRA
ncbi:hypothetical protein IIQ_02301 [Bacillus cereus VD118]|uniref:Uncharacterized protein n=1 Tax=Bacillus cereus VD118 TaxID=1053231 RepID=R8QCC9_BACCE|nr:hypothetical protein IIQ_02301 [Bacillus cereus VD118]